MKRFRLCSNPYFQWKYFYVISIFPPVPVLRFFDSRETIKSEGIKRFLEHHDGRSIRRRDDRSCILWMLYRTQSDSSFSSASTRANGWFVVKRAAARWEGFREILNIQERQIESTLSSYSAKVLLRLWSCYASSLPKSKSTDPSLVRTIRKYLSPAKINKI